MTIILYVFLEECRKFRLNAGDLKFLNDRKKVMTLIAASLDVLQGEEKAYMGILLPTIASVLNALKIERLMSMDYCHLLLETLIDSVQARFIMFASFC